MRRRRKGPDALLTAQLDAVWSALVRSKGFCERCERGHGVLHAHHIIGRRNHRTRFEPRNGCCLCYRCHRWAHEEPLEFADWIRSHRPRDVAYLERAKNEVSHFTAADKRSILEDLRSSLERELAA